MVQSEISILTRIYMTVLDNAGLTYQSSSNGKLNVINVLEDMDYYDVFINAYQSMIMATPYKFDINVYDGEKYEVLNNGKVVIRVYFDGKGAQ